MSSSMKSGGKGNRTAQLYGDVAPASTVSPGKAARSTHRYGDVVQRKMADQVGAQVDAPDHNMAAANAAQTPQPKGRSLLMSGPDTAFSLHRQVPLQARMIDSNSALPVMCKTSSGLGTSDTINKPGDDVHAVATKGVQGSGQQLPHLGRIQAALGDHDVSRIDAHVGGNAAAAGRALGAHAYATGNSVAFNGPPDLHTAAHEAAHVIQQRAGVQLKGGIGKVGDRYEQNADAVADRVVAGQSAQDLLPAAAGQAAAAVPQNTAPIQMRPHRDDLEDPFNENSPKEPKKDRDALEDPFTNKAPAKKAGHRDDLEDPFGGVADKKGGDDKTTITIIDLSPAKKDDAGKNELGLSAEETKKTAAMLSRHAGIVEKRFTDASKNAKAGADKRRGDIDKQNPRAKTKKDKPPPKQLDQLKLRISIDGLDKSPIRPIQRAMAVRFLAKAFAHYGVKKMGGSSLVKLVDASGWKTQMNGARRSEAWWKRWVKKKLNRGITTTSYKGTGVWEALDKYQRHNERRALALAKFRRRLGTSKYAQNAILTFYKAQVNGTINIINGAITLASAGKVKNLIPKLKYHGEYAKKNAAVLEAGATITVGVFTGALASKGFAALSTRLSGVVVNGVNVGDKILFVAKAYLVGSGLNETHALAEQARDDILLLATKEALVKRYTTDSGSEATITRPATKEELKNALDRIIMTAAGTVAGAAAGRGMQAKGGKAGSGKARVKRPGLPKATARKTGKKKTAARQKAKKSKSPIPREVEAVLGEKIASIKTAPNGTEFHMRDGQKRLRWKKGDKKKRPPLSLDADKRVTLGTRDNLGRPLGPAMRKKSGKDKLDDHQDHHLVPVEVARDHRLFQRAAAKGKPKWSMNDPDNGIELPNSPDARVPDTQHLPVHNTNHNGYSGHVWKEATKQLDKLTARYGKNIPGDKLTDAANRVRSKMKNKFDKWDKNKDGDKLK